MTGQPSPRSRGAVLMPRDITVVWQAMAANA